MTRPVGPGEYPLHLAPNLGRRPELLLASGAVRAMFYAYLTVIVTGIVYFSIIGLTHH